MNGTVTAALILSTAADLALAAWCLLRRPGSRVGLVRVVQAAAAGGALFAVKAMVLVSLAGSFFFLLNLAYTDVVVMLPLVGLAVLAAARRRPVAGPVRALAWSSLALPPLGAWGTFVEPFRLVTETAAIRVDPRRAPLKPLEIGVLADIQSAEVSEHLRRAVRRVMEAEPDLILMPGDLMQCESVAQRERELPRFRELLRPLSAPLGVYFVLGNTDRRETVVRALAGTRVRLLENETITVEHAGRRVAVAGAGFDPWAADTHAFLRGLEEYEHEEDLVILCAHYPDVYRLLAPDSRVDLVVAGHTHGGQVQIPWFGPPLTLSTVPRRVAAGGLHDLDGRLVYVSRGIGCERAGAPRVRILCPPEVSLLTLEASE